MIPNSSSTLDSKIIIGSTENQISWQKQLATAFRSVDELLEYLKIEPSSLPDFISYDQNFPFKVTYSFAKRMAPSDINDPLLKQVLPLKVENLKSKSFNDNPIEEQQFLVAPGLIHKYKNRALLIAHSSCAIHCRYCFRRHFPYQTQSISTNELDLVLKYLSEHTDITEIILSGGDPLSLSDQKLGSLIQALSTIESLTTVRFHTRTPVVLPSRVTTDLINTLKSTRLKPVVVLHINHPNEINLELQHMANKLSTSEIPLFNQTVLLKDVNDNVDTLRNLSELLFKSKIMPYYLHLMDPVQGAEHFNVSDKEALKIWLQLQAEISGYLLPKLVRDTPHKQSKTWLCE